MIKKSFALKIFIQYAIISLGCLLYSLGITLFLDANKIAAGGVSGLSILLSHITPLDMTGVWIVILNVPLFILGIVSFGKNFTVSTLYSTLLSSGLIELFNFLLKDFLPLTNDIIIAGVVGGVLAGAGMGLVYKMGSTTGGTDILVKFLRKKFRYLKTGVISLILDVIIIAVSAFFFHDDRLAFYTTLSLIVTIVVLDWVLYGTESGKLVYIITDDTHAAAICEKILGDLDISATCLDGAGAYTGDKKRIVMCAVKKMLYHKLCDYIRDIDPAAFTIVTSAKEIYGEGYKDHKDREL